MSKKLNVYLAGPFFNEKQLSTIKMLEDYLESRGYRVYSPRRDGLAIPGEATYDDREQVFQWNVQHTTESDLIVAVIDDRDTGTSWEMGCRYGHWLAKVQQSINYPDSPRNFTEKIPAIVTFTAHDYGVNLMLLHSILKHCKGTKELGEFLDQVDSLGVDNVRKDDESIRRTSFI